MGLCDQTALERGLNATTVGVMGDGRKLELSDDEQQFLSLLSQPEADYSAKLTKQSQSGGIKTGTIIS